MHKSNVTISNRLALTIKSGDLSNGNDCTYEGCGGGITVFAVPPLSQERARENSLIIKHSKLQLTKLKMRLGSKCEVRK